MVVDEINIRQGLVSLILQIFYENFGILIILPVLFSSSCKIFKKLSFLLIWKSTVIILGSAKYFIFSLRVFQPTIIYYKLQKKNWNIELNSWNVTYPFFRLPTPTLSIMANSALKPQQIASYFWLNFNLRKYFVRVVEYFPYPWGRIHP